MILEYQIQHEIKEKNTNNVRVSLFALYFSFLANNKKMFSITLFFNFFEIIREYVRYITNAILVFEFAIQRYPIDLPKNGYHDTMKCALSANVCCLIGF